MTVAIALRTKEAVVLGTDSTTTCSVQGGQVAQLFNSAQKIFEIGPRLPHFTAGEHFSGGLVTFGDGGMGPLSWREVVNSFYREKVRPKPEASDAAPEFLAFIQNEWQRLQQSGQVAQGTSIPNAGFFIATIGANAGTVLGALVKLQAATVEPLALGQLRVEAGGDVVRRLLWGYDDELRNSLLAAGLPAATFDACAAKCQVQMPLDALPLRDAVDFVHFLVYSTIKLHRYRGALAMIGGAVEIAVVTADRGFRWIVHKPLQESIGIPRGGLLL